MMMMTMIKNIQNKQCTIQFLMTLRPMRSHFPSSGAPQTTPPVYMFIMVSSGMEYPCGQFGSDVLAMSLPSFLLAEHEKLRSPSLV